jgi:hypothetical protein
VEHSSECGHPAGCILSRIPGDAGLTCRDGEVVNITLENGDIAITSASDPFLRPEPRSRNSNNSDYGASRDHEVDTEPRTLEILEDAEDTAVNDLKNGR